jgi:hypothetical protein
MADQKLLPFAALTTDRVPYFALVLVPGRQAPR